MKTILTAVLGLAWLAFCLTFGAFVWVLYDNIAHAIVDYTLGLFAG